MFRVGHSSLTYALFAEVLVRLVTMTAEITENNWQEVDLEPFGADARNTAKHAPSSQGSDFNVVSYRFGVRLVKLTQLRPWCDVTFFLRLGSRW